MDAVGFTLVEVWGALAAVPVCLVVLLALPGRRRRRRRSDSAPFVSSDAARTAARSGAA
jgi:hypothetical protein